MSKRGELALELIAPHMQSPLPARDAAILVEWTNSADFRPGGNRPLPLTSRREWGKWIIAVRRSSGLAEYTLWDKVYNRLSSNPSTPIIPAGEGQSPILIWLLAILGLVLYTVVGSFVLGAALLFVTFFGAAVLYGIGTFLSGLFRS